MAHDIMSRLVVHDGVVTTERAKADRRSPKYIHKEDPDLTRIYREKGLHGLLVHVSRDIHRGAIHLRADSTLTRLLRKSLHLITLEQFKALDIDRASEMLATMTENFLLGTDYNPSSDIAAMRNTTAEVPLPKSEVYIRTFGKLEIENDMGRVEESVKSSALWALLKYLLVNSTREVELTELCETVWPGGDPDNAESAARVRLNRLRAALNPIGLGGRNGLVIHRMLNFTLNPDCNVRTDADEFTELLAEISRTPVDDAGGLALCKQALELYRGPYLQYTDKDFWFESIQESYQKDFCSLVYNTLDRIKATGNSEVLSLLSQRVLAFGGNDLELHRAVLACIDKFSGETVKKRYITQLMRSGFVADWLSTL